MSSASDPSRPAETGPEVQQTTAAPSPRKRRSRRKKVAMLGGGLVATYLAAAYVIVPFLWVRYERRHPSLDDVPRITHTRSQIPGDPLNVSLIGTEEEVKHVIRAAKWHPTDTMALKSSLLMVQASLFKRSYEDAPVSSLYLGERKQDLAFQQSVGNNPRQRHHVRFWRSDEVDPDGRPVWVGAATYDDRVGLSHTTGQVTHHTAAEIDTERAKLFADLKETGELADFYVIEGFHKVCEGRNGGGDPWRTDGHMHVGVIRAATP